MTHTARNTRLSPLVVGTALLTVESMLMPVSAAPLTLTVEADTFTSALVQSTNYGSSTKIDIEGDGSYDTNHRVGFFRFDSSTYTGGTSSGSYLTLKPLEQISSTSQEFEIYGISDNGFSENFFESALVWSNSGYGYGSGETLSDSGQYSDLVNLGTLLGVTDADEGSNVEFGSAALDDFLTNDTNNIVTFLVYNTNGTGSFNGFESKETAGVDTGTTLTLIPEPSSMLFVALGFVAALGLARKRCV